MLEHKWRNLYYLAIMLLVILGIVMIKWGSTIVVSDPETSAILLGLGVACGPSAIIAVVFRLFLFDDIQRELTGPVVTKVGNSIEGRLDELMTDHRRELDAIRERRETEVASLASLDRAGVSLFFADRKVALEEFGRFIVDESTEITVIGSSLKGLLLGDSLTNKELRRKVQSGGQCRIRFVLTHPFVADLRATQEGRTDEAIGAEILESLEMLKDWGLDASQVKLYGGTPTCFGIQTSRFVLLNPYAYADEAYKSPCFIAERKDGLEGYVFDRFKSGHFDQWASTMAFPLEGGFDPAIKALRTNLPSYAQSISELFTSAGLSPRTRGVNLRGGE